MSLDGMRDMLSSRTDNAFPVYTLSVITDTMIWYIYNRYNHVHNKHSKTFPKTSLPNIKISKQNI